MFLHFAFSDLGGAQGAQKSRIFFFPENSDYFLSESVPIVSLAPELNFLAQVEVSVHFARMVNMQLARQSA